MEIKLKIMDIRLDEYTLPRNKVQAGVITPRLYNLKHHSVMQNVLSKNRNTTQTIIIQFINNNIYHLERIVCK